MLITFDTSEVERVLRNTIQYNNGFVAGTHDGLPALLAKIGAALIEVIGTFIDKMAAGNPSALHHIYEWGSVGGARLFEFNYAVGGNTIVFTGNTTMSSSVAPEADRPFWNKADVMETGQSVTVVPYGEALHFKGIFVRRPVFIANPGGGGTVGQFQRVTDMFFLQYVLPFLSTILAALQTPVSYATHFAAGALGGGFGTGVQAGYEYIANSPVGGVV